MKSQVHVYDPATGVILDKGQILGQQSINTLAAGPDGRIYGGTNTYNGAVGRFFAYDPATDSVAALKAYADGFGVDDRRWLFLTGPIDTIAHVCEGYFMLPADDLPGAHSTRFALVDAEGQIRAYYSGVDEASVNVLRSHLRQMLDEAP